MCKKERAKSSSSNPDSVAVAKNENNVKQKIP